jgi:hypothetical protein
MAEAGYFPGIIIYLSMWYRKREQTMRMAIFCDAAILAAAVANILVETCFYNRCKIFLLNN